MESVLHLEPKTTVGQTVEVAARLEFPGGSDRLWWRVPLEWGDAITEWADPFVVAFVFPFMQRGGSVHVQGRVSPSLLANLETFMAYWRAWCPDIYREVQIRALQEVEPPAGDLRHESVIPFSCGVDSCFTAWRHINGLAGRRSRKIGTAVVMNGFDIPLDQLNGPAVFGGLLSRARAMLGSLNIPCVPVSSNFHRIRSTWAHSHGAHLVAGLRLFGGRFDSALVPNSVSCDQLATIWGSHPLTDPLLGSRHFRIFDDGAECNRVAKAQLIAPWPEAMKHLRVRFGAPDTGPENCCACEKCIRSILCFRANSLPRPAAFAWDISDAQIRRVRFTEDIVPFYWEELLREARRHGLAGTSWARAMAAALRRDRRRKRLSDLKQPFIPLRNKFRILLRGTALSKSQQARAAEVAAQEARRRS